MSKQTHGQTTATRSEAAVIFKFKLKQKKEDSDRVTKKILNYETRTLVDKNKLPEFRAEL